MSSVTIPNSFSASTKILSALVNANFTTLANFINNSVLKNDAAGTITATTTQLTLAYDGSHSATFTVSAAGLLTVNATTTVTITPAVTITGALTCSAAATVAGLLSATAGVAFSGADTTAYALYRLAGGTNNPGVFIKATEATSRTELYGSGSAGVLDLWLGAGGVSGVIKMTATAVTVTTPLAITGALTGATTGAFSGAVSTGALTCTTITASGAINGQTISATANFTGSVVIATTLNAGATTLSSLTVTALSALQAVTVSSTLVVTGVITSNGHLNMGPSKTLSTAPSQNGQAGFNIPSGTAPGSPNDGDIWYDGTNVKIRVGATTKTFTIT